MRESPKGRDDLIYEQLQARLDEFPVGAPPHESLTSILTELFSVEEASVAVKLPMLPTPLPEIIERTGGTAESVGRLCEAMADKGLVFATVRKGISYYSLLPLVPGMAELQFMKAERTPLTMRLARLFNTYYYSGWGQALSPSETPFARVVSVERAIPTGLEILPYEQAAEILRTAPSIALSNCYCRHEADLLGEGCGAPLDVCLVVGRFADFCAERGFARKVEVAEATLALDRAEEAGLVHVTENCRERVNFICNCCGCCCGILRGITRLGRANVVATSNYIAALDPDQCSACEACLQRCHVGAITRSAAAAGGLVIAPDRCIGCGLCTLACPTGAVVMRRRETVRDVPATWRELQARLLSEKR